MEISSYAPAALSFIFKPCLSKNLISSGSIGVGCTLNIGVVAKASVAKETTIIFNDKPIHFPTVEEALSSLTKKRVLIKLSSPLPLGFGFGISSSSTLASLLAVNKLFALKKSFQRLSEIAHRSEINNKTGLGSVATQITGGFLVKRKPGLPTKASRLPYVGKKLYAIIIQRLDTPSILTNKPHLSRISLAADQALDRINNHHRLQLEELLDIAFHFCRKSGLLSHQKVINLINQIRKKGGHATMAILGQVVLTSSKPGFNPGYPIQELIISGKRASL